VQAAGAPWGMPPPPENLKSCGILCVTVNLTAQMKQINLIKMLSQLNISSKKGLNRKAIALSYLMLGMALLSYTRNFISWVMYVDGIFLHVIVTSFFQLTEHD